MKLASPAPDFYDLLGYVHDMYRANKRFCAKLVKIAGNPQVFRELGDVLMQWVEDMEVPYANFSRSFISDLNKRQDIQENPQIRQLLNNLSANFPYEITLESLFNAPNQQLKYYKMLYSVPTEHHSSRGIKGTAPLPQINTSFQEHHSFSPNISSIEQQIDSLRVADIFSGIRVKYQLRLNPVSKIALRNNFVLLPDQNGGATARVHLILTNEVLIVCREQPGAKPYSLIYPPLRNHDVQVKSASIERELVGEYIIQFSILGKKNLTMRADEKEIRNIWLGLEENVSSTMTLAARPLISTVQKMLSQPSNKTNTAMLNTPDEHELKGNRGEVSPLDSDEDKNTLQFDEKTMLLSGRSPNVPVNQPKPENKLENIIPRTVMMFPQVPGHNPSSVVGKLPSLSSNPTPVESEMVDIKEPTKPTIVQMTFIPPVAVQKMTIVNTEPKRPAIGTFESINRSGSPHPASPRPIEVRQGVSPVAMQAVTQQKSRQQIPPQQYQQTPRQQIPPQQYQQNSRQQIPPQQYQQPLQQQQGYPTGYTNGYTRPLAPVHPMASKSSPYRGPGPQPAPIPTSNMLSPRLGPTQGGPSQTMMSPPNNLRTHSPQRAVGSPYPNFNTPSPSPSRSFGTASPSPRPQQGSPYSPDDSSSPPHSPNPLGSQANGIKQVVYSSSECEVFHWKDKTWYAAEGKCLLQIKLTHSNRACVAVQIQATGHLYLNAWILPITVIRQPSETDVSISVFMGNRKENYLVHFHNPNDALSFLHILQQMHYDSCQPRPYQDPIMARSSSLGNQHGAAENRLAENGPQTLQPVMQFKCKLFLQNETSSWSPFGSVSMRISQQIPSKRMHIYIENEKNKLVSSVVRSGNVEKVGNKKVTFLLKNEQERTSMVYMIQLKDEKTAVKTYDYLRVKNSEAEW
ncbi:hypothetical protein F4703DRAFT_1733783 [Phycomyces blakesleeanus]